MKGLTTYLINVINNVDDEETDQEYADMYVTVKGLLGEAREYFKISRELLKAGLPNESLDVYKAAQKSLTKVDELIKRYTEIQKRLDQL